jgi:anti-sigma B factor antagonist
MELTLSSLNGFPVASTSGPLDESARDPFREHLHPLVGQKGTRLIVDLAGSSRINSAGIGNLVALTADANTNDSRVVLCNLQPYVSMVVGVTKLDRFFTIVPDLNAAVAKCHET